MTRALLALVSVCLAGTAAAQKISSTAVQPPTGSGSQPCDGTTYLRGDGLCWAIPAGGVSDGNKGDLTVGSSGMAWTLNAGACSGAKVSGVAESAVTNLTTDLAAKAAASHTHAESEVTNLTTDLAAKAASTHTHAEADVTGLVTDLAGKAASSHTHTESQVTNLVSDLAAKAATSHTHVESDTTNLVTDLAAKAPVSTTPVIVKVAADVTMSSTTPANVTGLSWAVAANTTYTFDCHVVSDGTTTSAPRYQFTGPASPTDTRFSVVSYRTSATAPTFESVAALATLTTTCTTSCLATGTRPVWQIQGVFQNGANAGTLQLQIATSTAAQTVAARKGSWCSVL